MDCGEIESIPAPAGRPVSWLFGRDGALVRACVTGDISLAEDLLAEGADANARSGNGITPLHRAAQHGHSGIARMLKAGSDLK